VQPKPAPMVMERCSFADVHKATEVIVESFNLDPVYMFCFPNEVMRTVFIYSIFAPGIYFLNLRSTRVLKDESGNIVSTVIFEDERLNPILQLLGFILQSFGMYVCMFRKIVLTLGKSSPLVIATSIMWVPVMIFVMHLCMFWFGINLIRAYCAGASFGRADGWHKQKKKHLLAIGTLPSKQGKGYGSTLLNAAFAELEAEKYYGGYKLESSNPRNVAFYERNNFVSLGAAKLSGMTITLMVRPDLHRPAPARTQAA